MNRLAYAGLLLVLILFVSCSEQKSMEKKITSLENELFSDETQSIDMDITTQLVDAYVAFADAYPNDKKAVDYLFSAGNVAMNLLDPKKAIAIFDRIIKNYPEFDKVPHCLFLKAYTYENELRQLGQAETLYREFLDKYPGHDFADDAELSLKNLGKTPEELIMEFEKRNQPDSIPSAN